MNVAFIVNMRAGNFKGRRIWQRLKAQLTIPFTMYETTYAGHARDIAKSLAAQQLEQLIVVIGGDGTMHEVVNGVQNSPHIVLGYMKGGSANDFARAFTCFHNAKGVEAFVRQPKKISVDCGNINNTTLSKHFINNFGLGFDGFVSELVNESKVKKALNKIGLGKLSYAYFVAQALIQFRPFTLTVQNNSNEQQFNNVWFVTVSNQPYFGGGMNLSPISKVDDGILEVTVVNNLPRLKFLLLFLTVFTGKHTKFKSVTQFQVQEATFTVDRLVPMHTDGENDVLKEAFIRCEVVPRSVIIVK